MKLRTLLTAPCALSIACGSFDSLNGSGGSSGADNGSSGSTADPSGAAADTTGSASVGATEGGSTANAEAGGGDASDDSPVYWDVGGIPDTPASECGGGKGGAVSGVELSYIWIANTAQQTISKINTETMEEEGRYRAKPTNGDPSRTSVNLNGDVAVANRNGGVAKFWANPDDCSGSNTSSGGTDVLAWDEEDCRAWYHDMTCNSNRPVAWTRGVFSEATCSYLDAKLWTVCDSNVLLLNGDTGETEQTISIGGGGNAFVYGGAADADGNFWGIDMGGIGLFRVDHADYSVLSWPLPDQVNSYGITVDKEGRPWVCNSGVARFNLDTSTWSQAAGVSNGGGCMTDGDGIIWHSTNFLGAGPANLVGINIETLELEHTIPIPEYVHGISVDFQGNVWGVSFQGNNAYRVDPDSETIDIFTTLIGAYTYSDMTGFALSTAGGGVPQN